MAISRRQFLTGTGLTVAAAAIATTDILSTEQEVKEQQPQPLDNWKSVREQFELSHDYIHLATFFIASHPRTVREAIEKYRKEMDQNPFLFVENAMFVQDPAKNLPLRVINAAAQYVGGNPDEIAITNSTTMGLAMIYAGLPLKPEQEILTTEHDHYSHHESIRFAALKSGASMRKISLFDSYDSISQDLIVERIKKGVGPNTRAFGITWVHSSSGLKLPLRQIAAAISELNKNRDEKDRILLIVDGVHGFGVEDETIATTGIDFFAAGTHKWMLGPRGTGIIWGANKNWALLNPTIPSFYSDQTYVAWLNNKIPTPPTRANWVSPGGFHPYEHEWAVVEAFEFHQKLGKKQIADRIHTLNSQFKEELASMKHVKLYTPQGTDLSAGIVCFDVDGMKPEAVVEKLLQKKIIASTTPYGVYYARVAASLANTPEEVDVTLREIRSMG